MAKRRKVGNPLALALLVTLAERPMHPYEMASVVRSRGRDNSTKINWGSLYTVVQNLERHGFVHVTETTRRGGRPERTVYAITDAGHAELHDWLRELIGTPEREFSSFEAALSAVGVLPPGEVAALLRQRLGTLERDVAERRALLREPAETLPRAFQIESEFHLAVRTAEADWVRSLLATLTDGSLAGLAQWPHPPVAPRTEVIEQ
jgi:DNA-binding PadR family transcriptional regulator